jgi:hypothetical protein
LIAIILFCSQNEIALLRILSITELVVLRHILILSLLQLLREGINKVHEPRPKTLHLDLFVKLTALLGISHT